MRFPYERDAMHGLEMPDGLSLLDQYMFLSLRLLYQSHKKGAISREVGQIEKGKLVHQYGIARNRMRFEEDKFVNFADQRKRIEHSANAYAKNRTLDNADQMYKALYGMMPSKEEP